MALVLCILSVDYIFETKEIKYDFEQDSIDTQIQGEIYKITNGKNGDVLWVDDIEYSKVIVYLSSDNNCEYRVGNTIAAKSTLFKLEKACNEGGFDAYSYYYFTHKIKYTAYVKEIQVVNNNVNYLYDTLYRVRERLVHNIELIYNEQDAGIIKAMLFADKSSIDDDIKDLYTKNGIAHILAISGLHISILGSLIYIILLKITSSLRISTTISILIIFLYGIMTGFSVSTNRAIVMMVIMMIGKMIGRTYDMISAIGLSGIIILIQNAHQIYSTGFLLSFLSVSAVCIVMPALCFVVGYEPDMGKYIKEEKSIGSWFALHNIKAYSQIFFRKIEGSFIVSFSISIITMPVILYNYYEIQLLSVFINILVVPLLTIVVGISLFGSLVGMISVGVAHIISVPVHVILTLFKNMCLIPEIIHIRPWVSGRPKLINIIIYYAVILFIFVLFIYLKQKNIKVIDFRAIYISILMVAFILLRTNNDNKLHIDMLDVGQGDATFIRTADGKVLLVDGGSSTKEDIGENVLIKYLKYHGKNKIDYLFLSHMDDDHINGAVEIIEKELCEVGIIFLADIDDKEKEYERVISLARQHHIDVKYISQGDTLQIGTSEIEVIYPYKNIEVTNNNTNGCSLVFLLRYGKINTLFTGDIGKEQELEILDYMDNNKKSFTMNVVKSPHHGSKNSSCDEFLKSVNPECIIISAGKNNIYHHPSKETLKRMDEIGINYFVTIDEGQIAIQSDGNEIRARSIKKQVTIYE